MITLNTRSCSNAEPVEGIALAISVRASRYQTPGRLSTSPAANAIATDPRDSARVVIDGVRAADGSGFARLCLRRPRLMAPLEIPHATSSDSAPSTIDTIGLGE